MRRRAGRGVGVVALVGALLLSACGSDGSSDPASSPPVTGTPPPRHDLPPSKDGAGGTTLSTDAPEVTEAIADLAHHLGITPAQVSTLSYMAVTWPDGALGCPQPGMSYTQALVPGSRLLLEAGGVEYAYHAGRDADLVRCDHPQRPVRGGVN